MRAQRRKNAAKWVSRHAHGDDRDDDANEDDDVGSVGEAKLCLCRQHGRQHADSKADEGVEMDEDEVEDESPWSPWSPESAPKVPRHSTSQGLIGGGADDGPPRSDSNSTEGCVGSA